MKKIKLQISGNVIEVTERPEIITSGMIGLPVEFSFDSQWDGLSKIAIFRAGEKVIVITNPDRGIAVPWEVLENPHEWLSIGIYGVNIYGTVVIPTVWVDVAKIHTGANPEGDETTDPTLPVWAQIQSQLDHLTPEAIGAVSASEFETMIDIKNAPLIVTVNEYNYANYPPEAIYDFIELGKTAYFLYEGVLYPCTRCDRECAEFALFYYEENRYQGITVDRNSGYVFFAGTLTGEGFVDSAVIEHAGKKDNPHGVTAEQAGAAPAGYGLGENFSRATNWNAGSNGFIRANSNSPDGGIWHGIVCKDSANTGSLVDIAFKEFESKTSDKYPYAYLPYALEARRHRDRGSNWGEWEYVNPPMELGVEYRTTERWNSKPVWTSLTKVAGLPNRSLGTYDLAATDCDTVVGCHVTYERTKDGSRSTYSDMPEAGETYVGSYGAPYLSFVETKDDLSDVTAYVTLFYTKTTD